MGFSRNASALSAMNFLLFLYVRSLAPGWSSERRVMSFFVGFICVLVQKIKTRLCEAGLNEIQMFPISIGS